MPPSSSIRHQLKNSFQALFRRFGYQIQKLPHRLPPTQRPVGQMSCFLEDLLTRGFRPHSILDVGANEGAWSRMAAAVFPDASYLMIEPQREMRPYLEQFCRDFPQARWVEAGAGATEGELTLTVWEDFQGSSFLSQEHAQLEGTKKRRVVRILTLDSLYEKNTPLPDLVKLDIQGFELEALKGAQRLLGTTELFVLEVSLYKFMTDMPLISEVIAFMTQWGYDIYDFPGFARRPFDGALGQADIAFARRNGSLRTSSCW